MDKLFHVHTYRCGHAENVPDEAYLKKALDLGYKEIYFSDHGPFPGDPFGNRMSCDRLPEYLQTLGNLKQQYEEQIAIHVGLEIEYLPSFQTYYEDLKAMDGLDFLLLGQHFCELRTGDVTCLEPGPKYSFQVHVETLVGAEYRVCGLAQVEAMRTGLFDYVAHPDRIFRRRWDWSDIEKDIAREIMATAREYDVPLERNLASMRKRNYYWPEFWEMLSPDQPTIIGFDAHFLNDIDMGHNQFDNLS